MCLIFKKVITYALHNFEAKNFVCMSVRASKLCGYIQNCGGFGR